MEEKNKEVEIDLLELARKLWDNKKFIIKITLIGVVVGLVIAFSIPKEYTSTVVFTTNSNDAKTGNMGALASLAGINLSNMGASDAFSPELYPNIVSSTPFIQGLYDINVSDKNLGVDTTLYSYIENYQKRAWWHSIFALPTSFLNLLKSKNTTSENVEITSKYFLSEDEAAILDVLRASYRISTEKKTGITTLEVTTQSSQISAFLADTLISYLQEYIIKERTKKAKTDLENTEKLYEQSKKNYYEVQEKLASFVDANQNLISARYKTNQEKLQNEVSLAYSVYSQMAQQIQLNKIKVQDDTPVFTIIQPAVELPKASKPSKKVIVSGICVLGFILACAWTLRKDLQKILATS